MRKLLKVAVAVISLMFLSCSVAAAEVDNSNSTPIRQPEDAVEYIVKTISTPLINPKELECLAKNIFYESGSEPKEGKIAVGMVTINRSQDDKFPDTICGVVKQRTAISVPHTVTKTFNVKVGFFGKIEKHTETTTEWKSVTVCQFSWYCMKVPKPKSDDPRWEESREVAENLLTGGYEEYQGKYGNLKYFHNVFVRPAWRGLKRIVKIGGHIFYASNE